MNAPWKHAAPSSRMVDAAGVSACVFLLGLAYMVGLAPRLRERAQAVQQRADLDSGRRELTRLGDERRGREIAAAALHAQLASGPLRPSSAREVNQRVQVIVEMADRCGLKISEFSPGTPVSAGRLVVVPIKLRGTGGYAAVTDLIARLHERHPDTAVSSLSLSGSVLGEIPPEFSVEFAWHTAPDVTAVSDAGTRAK